LLHGINCHEGPCPLRKVELEMMCGFIR
jgi:hypothetical protein